jgi:PAS domain S-box-containing protein
MGERRYKLLIVDGSPEDREALRRALARGDEERCEFVEAELGADGLAVCREAPPDCVILDHVLPDMTAPQFLAALTEGRSETPVPVVVVTARGNEAVAVAAMKAGAHDYLVKGAAAGEVERAVRTAMERHARLPPQVYRLLVIDDSPEDREAYRRLLSRGPEKFEFCEAETGEEGLVRCHEFQPDCVLVDYNLPDTDGLEVLTQLVHECGSGRVAVMMLTGQGNEAIAVRALKAGAEDYLVKGPALAALPQAVRVAVEKVTLRRRLDEQRQELERSRKQLQVTLASIGDAVIATDPTGRVTFMNAVAEELTGWRSEEAQGRPLAEVFVIVNEQSRLPTENPATRALREGRVVGLANHTLLIARDGTQRPIDDSAAPIRDEAGEVFGAVLVFRDISERHRTEQSLLLQSRVLDSMTEGVSVADEAGIIFYTNPAEDRMLGYARGELIGQPLRVRSDDGPEQYERRTAEIRERLRGGGTWTGELRTRRKDGSSFTSYTRISRLQTGGAEWLVYVHEDVSDRRRLEDELQHRVNELALAHKHKDEFLAMLAHELRNPLAPIKNALHILKLRRDDGNTVDRMHDIMVRQAGHLGRLVDDLLDVSRITQGKVTLKLERLDLARLARECVADHQAEFQAARIALTAQTPETPVWVNGDATRLTQIVDNFLSNAVKFTNPEGAVSVAVTTNPGGVQLAVRDNGIGIEPEVLPTVFDVFSQADKTLARSPGGLGLGLAIVDGLVKLHGGSVRARSEGLGRGTEMIVSLPGEQEPAALVSSTRRRSIASRRLRVLVIEDNLDSAESLRMLLEVSGYEVRVAHTGRDGVRAATEWRPDAVVCDLGLPEMDGFSVARELRRRPATAGARLIAVTGYGREEDVAEARAAGFEDHLMKPADPERLLELLAAIGASERR